LRRVGLNALYLLPGRVGGSEVYALELTRALARQRTDVEFVLFCGREAADALRQGPWPANVVIWRLPVTVANKPLRVGAELLLLPVAARRAQVDLLHSLGTTSPLVAGVPSVVTILDLIYEHFPTTFSRLALLGLKALVGPGATNADRVIAISQAVKDDVVERLGVPADRVDVVHLGFGMQRAAAPTPEAELRSRLGLEQARVVLCVSAALAHKNLDRLIRAFARLEPASADLRLVIAGHPGRETERLVAVAHEAGVVDRVTLTGWISDRDLEGLYALTACCAYPSLHEGFGLPVLEAMARGVPIACSRATSLPEVAGDAAELFDPLDVDAIASAIGRLLHDPDRAASLLARGHARAASFTWERCAAGVLASYQRVLGSRQHPSGL
jgi:glycosyltransferase involved in cell wall biosynthesis